MVYTRIDFFNKTIEPYTILENGMEWMVADPFAEALNYARANKNALHHVSFHNQKNYEDIIKDYKQQRRLRLRQQRRRNYHHHHNCCGGGGGSFNIGSDDGGGGGGNNVSIESDVVDTTASAPSLRNESPPPHNISAKTKFINRAGVCELINAGNQQTPSAKRSKIWSVADMLPVSNSKKNINAGAAVPNAFNDSGINSKNILVDGFDNRDNNFAKPETGGDVARQVDDNRVCSVGACNGVVVSSSSVANIAAGDHRRLLKADRIEETAQLVRKLQRVNEKLLKITASNVSFAKALMIANENLIQANDNLHDAIKNLIGITGRLMNITETVLAERHSM
nr:bro-c [Calliteara abietis nucleopolyhedrovirus]